MPSGDDDLLSVTEAARAVGVSGQTLRVALRKGRLRGHRVGQKLYKIRRSDLDHYIRPAKEQTGGTCEARRDTRSTSLVGRFA
jgi:excisionase family DNA binding protein